MPANHRCYHAMTMKTARLFLFLLLALLLAIPSYTQMPPNSKEVEAVYPAAHALYVDLHRNPELSTHESQTASKLAARLRSLGYEVTEGDGGAGVVALLQTGAEPTI